MKLISQEEANLWQLSDPDFKNSSFLTGNQKTEITDGIAIFDSIQIFAKPGSSHYLVVYSDAIKQFQEDLRTKPLFYEKNYNEDYFIIIKVNIRKCLKGEIFQPEINKYLLFFF